MFGFLHNIGATELIIVLVVCLLVFGAGRLPEIGRSLGSGIKEFKKGIMGGDKDDEATPRQVKNEQNGQ